MTRRPSPRPARPQGCRPEMLTFPLWKRLLVIGLCLIGLAVALPNLFYSRVEQANDARARVERGAAETPGARRRRGRAGRRSCPRASSTSASTCAAAPTCWSRCGSRTPQADRMEGLWPELRDRLRDLRDQVGAVRRLDGPPEELRIRIGEPAGMEAALAAVAEVSQPVFSITGAGDAAISSARADGADVIVVTLSEPEIAAMDERTMQQSLEIIRRRVDETGTREPSIQRQGADRILIQVPGIGSAEELLAIIGQTARLSFHPVVSRTTDAEAQPGLDEIVLPSADEPGRLLRARAPRGGHRRPAGRQPARVRPERPAGGQLPLQPAGRRGLRPLHRREHRQPVRDRARRRGDLGAGDPEPHPRRHRHHHRQLHPRGIRRGSRSCCAPARCPPRSACSSSAPSGRSSARIRSRPAVSPRRSRWRRWRSTRSPATASSVSSPASRCWST